MNERLKALIESFRRKHHRYCDEDCWYSCPAHPEYCGDETGCDCGLEEHNNRVDEALRLLEVIINDRTAASPANSK